MMKNVGVSRVEAPVKSVGKALDLLDLLVFGDINREGMGLFDLSRRLGLKPNTARNLLKSLISRGYVMQNAESKYLLGERAESIGKLSLVASKMICREVFEPIVSSLVNDLHEYAALTFLIGGMRVVSVSLQPEQVVTATSQPEQPFFSMATSRVMAAFAGEEDLNSILKIHGYPWEEWNGIRTGKALRKALDTIRDNGFEYIEKTHIGTIAIAVPVLPRNRDLCGSIATSIPHYRFDEKKKERIIKALRQTATRVASSIDGLRT